MTDNQFEVGDLVLLDAAHNRIFEVLGYAEDDRGNEATHVQVRALTNWKGEFEPVVDESAWPLMDEKRIKKLPPAEVERYREAVARAEHSS